MKVILSFLLAAISNFIFAQKPEPPPPPPPKSGEEVFQKVEIIPSFPGGEKGWTNYLLKNLDPEIPLTYGAPAGTFTVTIKFMVDKDGVVSDVKALTNHGFGMEEEAIRLIKKGPNWLPGMQNGRKVKMYRKQPITFIVAE